MLAHSGWHIMGEKLHQAIGRFLPVLINAQINAGCQCIDVSGYFTGRVIGFSIGKIIYQLCKITGHFVCIAYGMMFDPLPPVFMLFYK